MSQTATRKELLKLSKKELIKKCKEKNIAINGSKSDMIDRLINTKKLTKKRKKTKKKKKTKKTKIKNNNPLRGNKSKETQTNINQDDNKENDKQINKQIQQRETANKKKKKIKPIKIKKYEYDNNVYIATSNTSPATVTSDIAHDLDLKSDEKQNDSNTKQSHSIHDNESNTNEQTNNKR